MGNPAYDMPQPVPQRVSSKHFVKPGESVADIIRMYGDAFLSHPANSNHVGSNVPLLPGTPLHIP